MNGKAHTAIGVGAGIAAGYALALRSNRQPTLPEMFGWAVGGILGAKVPDLLEPAYCPAHRKFCHSGCALLLNLLALQSETLESWIQSLHEKAGEQRMRSLSEPENALFYSISAILYEFVAGALPGLIAGYASHLIADSTTPCGIPLVT